MTAGPSARWGQSKEGMAPGTCPADRPTRRPRSDSDGHARRLHRIISADLASTPAPPSNSLIEGSLSGGRILIADVRSPDTLGQARTRTSDAARARLRADSSRIGARAAARQAQALVRADRRRLGAAGD